MTSDIGERLNSGVVALPLCYFELFKVTLNRISWTHTLRNSGHVACTVSRHVMSNSPEPWNKKCGWPIQFTSFNYFTCCAI